MLNKRVGTTVVLSLMMIVSASATEFDFKDPKNVNAVSFLLDSPLEPIVGIADGFSGTINFDPDAPEKTTGALVISAASVRVSNTRMTEVMQGKKWLDIASHPTISFTFSDVQHVKQLGSGTFELTVSGEFSLKGVTQPMTVPIHLSHAPDKLAKRGPGKSGDLLLLRSAFSIRRSDYGIMPGKNLDKVADIIEFRLAIAGGSPK